MADIRINLREKTLVPSSGKIVYIPNPCPILSKPAFSICKVVRGLMDIRKTPIVMVITKGNKATPPIRRG